MNDWIIAVITTSVDVIISIVVRVYCSYTGW